MVVISRSRSPGGPAMVNGVVRLLTECASRIKKDKPAKWSPWRRVMKISTVRQFRDNATGYLRSKDPILVTRRGRLAGVFFPRPESSLPIELKRELFSVLSSEVAREIKKRSLKEEDIVAEFESWRKNK